MDIILNTILSVIEARRSKRIDCPFYSIEGWNTKRIKLIGFRELTDKGVANASKKWRKEHEATVRYCEEKFGIYAIDYNKGISDKSKVWYCDEWIIERIIRIIYSDEERKPAV